MMQARLTHRPNRPGIEMAMFSSLVQPNKADGDIPPQPDDDERVTKMRDVFDCRGGKIRQFQIKTSGSDKVHRRAKVDCCDKQKRMQRWKVKKK